MLEISGYGVLANNKTIFVVMANTALYNSLDNLARYRLRDTRAGDLVV